jgi:hypothetical protein
MTQETREDTLCNRLIDLYNEEKSILGKNPDPMPARIPLFVVAAQANITPAITLHNISDTLTTLRDNTLHIVEQLHFNDAMQAQLWPALSILGMAALLGRLPNEKQKLHSAPSVISAPAFNRLQEIDLERYTITLTNSDIFSVPHYRDPQTPERYNNLTFTN